MDWKRAPIDTTMHIAFLLVTIFMGPLGVLVYVLTAREPLPGTHTAYIALQWKQAVGSTLHCVAGDSIGIVGAAVITGVIRLPMVISLLVEYAAGFLVGWLIFQALFMKDMVGGSYLKAVRTMFMPEWLSMNGVMAGMAIIMVVAVHENARFSSPVYLPFWFMMAMALILGSVLAYPINWWLVAHKLKHGIMSTAGSTRSHTHHSALRHADAVMSAVQENAPIKRQHTQHRTRVNSTSNHPYNTLIVLASMALFLASLALAVWID